MRLLDADPDLGQFLTEDEQREARALMVPVVHVSRGVLEPGALLSERNAFAIVILDGMVLVRLRLGQHSALRLLGPGDLLSPQPLRFPGLSTGTVRTAASDAHLLILGDEVLAAARRWPRLIAGLSERTFEQSQRVAAQLLLCQLSRVTDRVLGIMWLLAESWGRVTPAGVILPLALTHELIGEMIGARRPTVSLAVGDLVRRGAILRQDHGWLLLEALPEHEPSVVGEEEHEEIAVIETSLPAVIRTASSQWASVEHTAIMPPTYEEMKETVDQLHAQLEKTRQSVRAGIDHARQCRERVARRRAEWAKASTRRAPSS